MNKITRSTKLNKSTKVSETYQQLSEVFKALESAHFEEGRDYGENLTGCFKWFISPPAVIFLEKKTNGFWTELKRNPRFSWNLLPWDGYTSRGIDITLVM